MIESVIILLNYDSNSRLSENRHMINECNDELWLMYCRIEDPPVVKSPSPFDEWGSLANMLSLTKI